MPEENGSNKAKGLVSNVGNALKNTGRNTAKGISKSVSKLFKEKKKWIAAISSVAIFWISIILIMAILFTILASVIVTNEGKKQAQNIGSSLQPIGTFYPRLEEPVKGKASVNHTGKKVDDYYFNSTNPLEAAGYGMPNCTAYVWSRAYEMLDNIPNLCTGNAEQWYDYNKTYDYYPYGSEPRLGAIAVWSHDNSGHVAVVEKIEGTKVTFSNSAWQSTFFFLLEVDSSTQPNYWNNSNWNFLGFIYVFDELQSGYGGYGGASALAAVAKAEVDSGSHYGGQKYWSWYGFDSRVDWCACFVSYCFNKCGMMTGKPGEGRKCAHAGMSWYKENGHYLPGSATPSPGMIVVFGEQSHIGIVIDVKGNTIYTAEGNTYDSRTGRRDSCGFHQYTIGDPYIYGFGTFNSYDGLAETNTQVPQSESEFVQMFYRYFKNRGYSKASICGILGNIFAECSMDSYWYFAKYVPDAGGASGNSGGICMWYDANCDRFKRDCPNWNKSVMAQFQYLAGTLDNDGQGSYNTKYYYWCTGCKASVQNVPNSKSGAQQAAINFMKNYERPNLGFDQSIRWIKAAQYWDML